MNSGYYYFSDLLISFLFQVSDHVSRPTADLKVRVEKDEIALKENEKEWKSINEDLLLRVELLSKEKVEKEEEHAAEVAEVIFEVRGSVVVAVWDAKIKIAEDVANVGSWNVDGWCEALAKQTGEHVNTSQDHVKQKKVGGQKEEARKVPGGDNKTMV